MHKAVCEFESITLVIYFFLKIAIFFFKIAFSRVSFKFHFNDTDEGLITIKLSPLRAGVPGQIWLEG